MDAWMDCRERRAAEAARKRPSTGRQLTLKARQDPDLGPDSAPAPTDLYLEATEPSGEVAVWFDDAWWMGALARWGDDSVRIHLLPSRGALLNPVVIHHMSMLLRVAPNWRLIGYGYADDLAEDAVIERIACSPYHEVRMKDGREAGKSKNGNGRRPVRIEDLFSAVRRAQRRLGATRPALTRVTSVSETSTEPQPQDTNKMDSPGRSTMQRQAVGARNSGG